MRDHWFLWLASAIAQADGAALNGLFNIPGHPWPVENSPCLFGASLDPLMAFVNKLDHFAVETLGYNQLVSFEEEFIRLVDFVPYCPVGLHGGRSFGCLFWPS